MLVLIVYIAGLVGLLVWGIPRLRVFFQQEVLSAEAPDTSGGPKRLLYLEGLRGLASFIVVIFHFLLAGYPAVTSGLADLAHNPFEAWLPFTPLYLLYSGSFSVAIFFVMSGFVLSYPFFLKRKIDIPLSGFFRRYLRLAIPVFVTSLSYFLLLKLNWLSPKMLQEVSERSSSLLLTKIYQFTPSFVGMAWDSLVDVFFGNKWLLTLYNPVLWTMRIEFLGSLMVFGFLLTLGRNRYRWIGYLVLGVALLDQPNFLGFILGMGLCDLTVLGWLERLRRPVTLFALGLLGLYFAAFPHYMDPTLLSKSAYGWVTTGLGWMAVGNRPWFVMILGATLLMTVLLWSKRLQNFFSLPPLLFLGKISFSLYLTHFAVLCSLTPLLFLTLNEFFSFHVSALLCLMLSVPVVLAVAVLFYYWADKPGVLLSSAFYKRWLAPKIVAPLRQRILLLTRKTEPQAINLRHSQTSD